MAAPRKCSSPKSVSGSITESCNGIKIRTKSYFENAASPYCRADSTPSAGHPVSHRSRIDAIVRGEKEAEEGAEQDADDVVGHREIEIELIFELALIFECSTYARGKESAFRSGNCDMGAHLRDWFRLIQMHILRIIHLRAMQAIAAR